MVVRTSDIRGAGTDSNITICMFGTKDGQSVDSKTHKLDDSKVSEELLSVGGGGGGRAFIISSWLQTGLQFRLDQLLSRPTAPRSFPLMILQ